MTIRKAAAADIPVLAEIESGWKTSPGWGKKGIAAELQNPAAGIFVGEEDGGAVGFAGVRFLPPEAQITTVVVSRRSARRGFARELLGRIFAESAARGCSGVTLEVDETNSPAISLYLGTGFEIVGRRPKFYNGTTDAVLMTANIKRNKG